MSCLKSGAGGGPRLSYRKSTVCFCVACVWFLGGGRVRDSLACCLDQPKCLQMPGDAHEGESHEDPAQRRQSI